MKSASAADGQYSDRYPTPAPYGISPSGLARCRRRQQWELFSPDDPHGELAHAGVPSLGLASARAESRWSRPRRHRVVRCRAFHAIHLADATTTRAGPGYGDQRRPARAKGTRQHDGRRRLLDAEPPTARERLHAMARAARACERGAHGWWKPSERAAPPGDGRLDGGAA